MTAARRCAYQRGQVGSKLEPCCQTDRLTHVKDRILYKGIDLDLVVYSRSELVGSDHRPGIQF